MLSFGVTFASVNIARHYGVPQQLVDAIFDGRLGRVHLQRLYYNPYDDHFPSWAHHPREGEKKSVYSGICAAVDEVIAETHRMAEEERRFAPKGEIQEL